MIAHRSTRLAPPARRFAAIATLALPVLLAACREGKTTQQPAGESAAAIPSAYLGEVEVLNGCGIPGAAHAVRIALQKKGFDVVEVGNAPDRNYSSTLVAARRPNFGPAQRIAEALGIPRVIPFLNEDRMVDATVYVGRDYQEILKQ